LALGGNLTQLEQTTLNLAALEPQRRQIAAQLQRQNKTRTAFAVLALCRNVELEKNGMSLQPFLSAAILILYVLFSAFLLPVCYSLPRTAH